DETRDLHHAPFKETRVLAELPRARNPKRFEQPFRLPDTCPAIGHLDVLRKGERREDSRSLVGPAEAKPRPMVAGHGGSILVAKPDAPIIRPDSAGDDVADCALSRAVRSDEPKYFTFPDLEAHPFKDP